MDQLCNHSGNEPDDDRPQDMHSQLHAMALGRRHKIVGLNFGGCRSLAEDRILIRLGPHFACVPGLLVRPANRRAPPVFASILAIGTATLTSLLAIGTSILTSISAILTPILAPHHPWRLGLGI
jgi:hypothetical protein